VNPSTVVTYVDCISEGKPFFCAHPENGHPI
jgi:hypothetical protein